MSKNITMLARLYDSAASDLHNALASQAVSYTDERIKDKVRWLGDIAKTLSVVYQVESMRLKTKDATPLAVPDEQVVEDPVLKKAQKQQFRANNTQTDLSGFRSPGGWVP